MARVPNIQTPRLSVQCIDAAKAAHFHLRYFFIFIGTGANQAVVSSTV